jgi:hypothetical protein
VIEWEIEEEEFDSIELAAGVVPEVNPNHLSIIGLQPGVSTVTVVDEIGDSVEIEVEVLPKRFEYKTFYGFSSESSMVRYGYNSDRLSRGKYDRYNPLYTVERITVADSSIYIPYFRRRKGWYGKGAI